MVDRAVKELMRLSVKGLRGQRKLPSPWKSIFRAVRGNRSLLSLCKQGCGEPEEKPCTGVVDCDWLLASVRKSHGGTASTFSLNSSKVP
jgi:hypothetical protein